jgi:hypothetical protein
MQLVIFSISFGILLLLIGLQFTQATYYRMILHLITKTAAEGTNFVSFIAMELRTVRNECQHYTNRV